MKTCSTLYVTVVRWVDNEVVTVASSLLANEFVKTCKSFYSRATKTWIDVGKPNLTHKCKISYEQFDQLETHLTELRFWIGGKKWYWMQLINLVCFL